MHLDRAREHTQKLYGPGTWATSVQPNGDIAYSYFYHNETMPTGVSPKLSDEEVQAIAHGRVVLANLGNVHMRDGKWVSAISPDEDPAIPERLVSLNTLEQLLSRYGRPSVPLEAVA